MQLIHYLYCGLCNSVHFNKSKCNMKIFLWLGFTFARQCEFFDTWWGKSVTILLISGFLDWWINKIYDIKWNNRSFILHNQQSLQRPNQWSQIKRRYQWDDHDGYMCMSWGKIGGKMIAIFSDNEIWLCTKLHFLHQPKHKQPCMSKMQITCETATRKQIKPPSE